MNRIITLLFTLILSCPAGLSQSKLDAASKAELEQCNQAIAKAPTALNYALRARFYRVHELYKEAVEDDNRAIELSPTTAHAWLSRGGDRCGMGHYKEALPDLNKALSLAKYGDKVYINTLRERVHCYIHLGDKKSAYADAKDLVALGAEPASSLNDADLH